MMCIPARRINAACVVVRFAYKHQVRCLASVLQVKWRHNLRELLNQLGWKRSWTHAVKDAWFLICYQFIHFISRTIGFCMVCICFLWFFSLFDWLRPRYIFVSIDVFDSSHSHIFNIFSFNCQFDKFWNYNSTNFRQINKILFDIYDHFLYRHDSLWKSFNFNNLFVLLFFFLIEDIEVFLLP